MALIRQNCPDLESPVGPYVHAVRYGDVLYTSGLTAFGTKAQKGTIGEQAEVIFEQLGQIAKQHDTSLSQLIKVTIFVTSLDEIGGLRDALTATYGDNKPASSLVEVVGLFSPDLKVEIEAVVAV